MNNKIERNFITRTGVSKHLVCIICQDIYDNPIRINCGHTYCSDCLNKWVNENHVCPICREKINKKLFGKDLIALNIINDMEVACVNKECPWKSTLSDLENHIKFCYFDEKRMPEHLKNKFKDKKSAKSDEDITADNYLNFNSNSSLLARMYEKNKELINNVLDDKKEEESVDIIDLLSRGDINIDKIDKLENVETKENKVIEIVNINNIEKSSNNLKRKKNDKSILNKKRKSTDNNSEDDDLKYAIMLSLAENEK